jgi:hypothetical protein
LITPASFESVMAKFCISLDVSEEIGRLAHWVMDERWIVTAGIVRRVKGMGRENVDVGRMLFIRDKGDRVVGMGDEEWLASNFEHVRLEITKEWAL